MKSIASFKNNIFDLQFRKQKIKCKTKRILETRRRKKEDLVNNLNTRLHYFIKVPLFPNEVFV